MVSARTEVIWLDIVAKNSSSVTARAPYSPAAAPPGDYMIFALRDRGAGKGFKRYAPSEACWTRVVPERSAPGAPIWRYTGTPCSGNNCPGWQRLDNNNRTIAIAASGTALYQLHNNGRIWRYTGTPCSGNSCRGWRILDNNTRTVAIVAAEGSLFQMYNDGAIWQFTGRACRGRSCPGWRRLDNNPRTADITAGN